MGIPGLFGKYILKHVKQAIIYNLTNVYSLSFDLNSLLHEAFSKIYMETILEKGEKLIKEGKQKESEGLRLGKKGVTMMEEGLLLIAEGNEFVKQHKVGIKMIEKGEKLLSKNEFKAQKLIREGNAIIGQKVYMKRHGMSTDLLDKLEKDYHNMVWTLMNNVLNRFENVDTLILAVDGVAPGAKLKQQRQRRFKSALNNNAMVNFDSNVITPGTEFMIRLSDFLEANIKKFRTTLPRQVIYSSHLTRGEGEGKILRLYREGVVKNDTNGTHVLYGLDADLIMLSLLSPQNNIVLYRDSRESTDMLSINIFKKYIQNYLQTPSALHDFVIMTFLLGNDFLPHNLALEEMAETIEMMMDIYNIHKFYFMKDNSIDMEQLHLFLVKLAAKEYNLLNGMAYNDNFYTIPLTEAKTPQGFNIEIYRESYYNKVLGFKNNVLAETLDIKHNMGDNDIQKMVTSYLRMMCWNYTYYTEGMDGINHDLVYEYYYTPMLADLALYSENVYMAGYKAYNGMIIFNPLHQLLSVLPKTSLSVVPDIIKPYFNYTSPIYDLFPSKFINDKEGKIYKPIVGRPAMDNGIALIPIPDRIRIESTLYETPVGKQWRERENLVSIIDNPRVTAYNKYSNGADRKMNYEPRKDLNPRQNYYTAPQSCDIIPPKQQYTQKGPQYTQKGQQYVLKPTLPNLQQEQQKVQTLPSVQVSQRSQTLPTVQVPQKGQPNLQQQRVQTLPAVQVPQKGNQYVLKQPILPNLQSQNIIQEPTLQIIPNILPPMLNIAAIQNYIQTGLTRESKKTAKEMLFDEDWS
jgi:hypothetical protein